MSWLKNLFSRRRVYDNLSAEIREHLEEKVEELLATGTPKKEAIAAARREFGNVTQLEERGREVWRWSLVEEFLQDLRFGVRTMRKNPGFTFVAVLTLALGIGANTAIFSLIDTVMLKTLPVQNPDQLMVINIADSATNTDPTDPTSYSSLSNPLWEQIRDHQDVFSGAFSWSAVDFDLAQGGETHNARGLYVSGDYFNTLGVRPSAGRLIATGDDVRGCAGVTVLSFGFWQEHFGGAPSAIGSVLNLSNRPFQVIGVAAPGFFGVTVGSNFDVAVPLCSEVIVNGKNSSLYARNDWWLRAMGRPKPGIPLAQATQRLRALSPQVFSAVVPPGRTAGYNKDFVSQTLVAMHGDRGISSVRVDYFQPLEILMFVVGIVLLIACANIASLMLARAAARGKEISVRLALGASRPRLVRQLLTESVLLSFLGALLGIVFARWGCALLVHFISTTKVPVFLQLKLDGRVVAFTACVAVLTGLLFGVVPALRSTRISLASAMKGIESKDSGGHVHARPGRWIVAFQMSLSIVLVVVAGLFLRSLTNLLKLDLGFDRNNVLVISTNSSNTGLQPDQRVAMNQEILDRLKALPGAISVAESGVTPLNGHHWQDHFRLQSGVGNAGEEFIAAENAISPSYFGTLRSPILAGHNFDQQDALGAPRVCIINETLARKYLPSSGAIGQYLLIRGNTDFKNPPIQVVGILKDAKYESLREDIQPTVYLPLTQLSGGGRDFANRRLIFEIRSATPPAALAPAAEAAIAAVNKSISLEVHTMEEQVNDSLRQEKLLATISGFFGGLAMLMAMIGLYGVLAYMVTQRHKEIGIRMALGAGRVSILRLIMRDVSILLSVGIAAGLGFSWWATQFMQKLLFNLDVHDAGTILAAIGALTVVALIAGFIPARRATKVHPMEALRNE